MPPLLSIVLGVVVAALTVLALLALVIVVVLLLLLVLLALDLLLERNGVDRRAGVVRAWARLRRRAPEQQEALVSPARRAKRAPRPVPAPATPITEPAATGSAQEHAVEAAPRWVTADDPSSAVETPPVETPAAETSETVTEVLSVKTPPAPRATPRARTPRAPRPTPRRTPTPAPETSAPGPVDRDSAIDRLFAPLLESDRTEPLPRTPRAGRTGDED
ncbi:hypothetical protein [uncultured Amnibacterium sp.]|uniref:hypothetical protein n=1 Tax=uncultured Amnibacterium sp. TaxID=1631851 RepID=UPI0035CCA659